MDVLFLPRRNTMVDLGDLEKRINEDAELRARFIADPAKVLEGEGIIISPHMLASLTKLIKQQTQEEPEVKGSSVSPRSGGRPPRPYGLP